MNSGILDSPGLTYLINAIQSLTLEVDRQKSNASERGRYTGGSQLIVHILIPERLDGTQSKYRGFINQCRVYFKVNSERFDTDIKKVRFVVRLLKGIALE